MSISFYVGSSPKRIFRHEGSFRAGQLSMPTSVFSVQALEPSTSNRALHPYDEYLTLSPKILVA